MSLLLRLRVCPASCSSHFKARHPCQTHVESLFKQFFSTITIFTFLIHTTSSSTLPTTPSKNNHSTNNNTLTSQTSSNYSDFAYPLGLLIFIIIICGLIICVTILGNVLVCTAVAIVKKLRTPSNLLIVSLAVSDLLVASLVMPLALVYEVKGRWIFGQQICDVWTSLDVFLCTSSILNLCMISIDRYFVITRPFQYAMKRTPARISLMIFAVWLLSALISIPPLIGWQEEPKPFQCNISQNILYQLYATVGAFYLPLMVMVVIYYRIYKVSYRISKAEAKSKPATYGHTNTAPNASSLQHKRSIQDQFQLKPLLNLKKIQEQEESKKTPRAMRCLEGSSEGPALSWKGKASSRLQKIKLLKRFYTNNNLTDNESNTDLDKHQLKDQNINEKPSISEQDTLTTKQTLLQIPRLSTARPSKQLSLLPQNSSHLARENKATITLGVIMGTFIACWLPFFILALIKPFCSHHVEGCIPHSLGALFLWLGFANSFLNPIIYARFNREFRKPFKEILMCKCRGINRRLRTETYAEQYGPPSQERLVVTAGGPGHSLHSSVTHLNSNSQHKHPHKQPLANTIKKSAVVLYESDQDKTVTKLDNTANEHDSMQKENSNDITEDKTNEIISCQTNTFSDTKTSSQSIKSQNNDGNYNNEVHKKNEMAVVLNDESKENSNTNENNNIEKKNKHNVKLLYNLDNKSNNGNGKEYKVDGENGHESSVSFEQNHSNKMISNINNNGSINNADSTDNIEDNVIDKDQEVIHSTKNDDNDDIDKSEKEDDNQYADNMKGDKIDKINDNDDKVNDVEDNTAYYKENDDNKNINNKNSSEKNDNKNNNKDDDKNKIVHDENANNNNTDSVINGRLKINELINDDVKNNENEMSGKKKNNLTSEKKNNETTEKDDDEPNISGSLGAEKNERCTDDLQDDSKDYHDNATVSSGENEKK